MNQSQALLRAKAECSKWGAPFPHLAIAYKKVTRPQFIVGYLGHPIGQGNSFEEAFDDAAHNIANRPTSQTSTLRQLLNHASTYEMSEEEKGQQAVSFAYGNVKLANSHITRDMVENVSMDQ